MPAPDLGRACLSEDTSRDAEDRQVARWREMSPPEKLTLVAELTSAVDRLALAGIRQRYPHASEREWFLRLAVLKLGPALALRAYPEIHGLDDIG